MLPPLYTHTSSPLPVTKAVKWARARATLRAGPPTWGSRYCSDSSTLHYTHTVYSYCVLILCTHTLYSYCVLTLCTHIVHHLGLQIVDKLVVPEATGDYVMQWRWDCEGSAQVCDVSYFVCGFTCHAYVCPFFAPLTSTRCGLTAPTSPSRPDES
jgi:hypothetical protein